MTDQPTPKKQGSIFAGLIKGKPMIFISPDHEAGYFCEGKIRGP